MNKKEEKKNTNLKVEMISTDLLSPSECNPYKVLDDEAMAELVESIREYGMHSPIAVRKKEYGDKYEVLSGHRRLFAAQKLGLEKVPVIKMDISIDEALMINHIDCCCIAHKCKLLNNKIAFIKKKFQ